MSNDHTSLDRLVELLDERLRTSEWEILTALAAADEPLNYGALAEATGYTERTIKKRVGTLAEVVHGDTLLRTEGDPRLHPQFAAAVRAYADVDGEADDEADDDAEADANDGGTSAAAAPDES